MAYRDAFGTFDKVFTFLYDQMQQRREKLRGRRRTVSVLLHYMYFMCDIGSKPTQPEEQAC